MVAPGLRPPSSTHIDTPSQRLILSPADRVYDKLQGDCSELLMLRGSNPIEWAHRCREHAALHPDSKISEMLLELAAQCEALAERLGKRDRIDIEPDALDADG